MEQQLDQHAAPHTSVKPCSTLGLRARGQRLKRRPCPLHFLLLASSPSKESEESSAFCTFGGVMHPSANRHYDGEEGPAAGQRREIRSSHRSSELQMEMKNSQLTDESKPTADRLVGCFSCLHHPAVFLCSFSCCLPLVLLNSSSISCLCLPLLTSIILLPPRPSGPFACWVSGKVF